MTESRNGRRMRGNGRKSGDGRRGPFHIYACYPGYVIFAFLLASCARFILYIIKKDKNDIYTE